jgi:ribosomal protein S18 acetylase RimI-like enzyme
MYEAESSPVVRKARVEETGALAGVLARAFDDDPLTNWLFPEPDARKKRLPAFFRGLLRPAFGIDQVHTTRDLQGVAIWNPPGTFPLRWQDSARMGLVSARLLRLRIATCARGLLYFDRHHPKEPHWYLQMLGTEPAHQGHGVGSALIAGVLATSDEAGLSTYLEASKEANVPFYERHGFSVTETMHVPGGPSVFAMWRRPAN